MSTPTPLPYSLSPPPTSPPLHDTKTLLSASHSPSYHGAPGAGPPTSPSHLTLGRVGGWKSYLLICDCLILGAAAVWSYRCQHTQVVFRLEALSGRVVNAANLSALVTAGGTVLTAIWTFAMVILGRIWLLHRIKRKRDVNMGSWQAISNKGAILSLPYTIKIARLSFLLSLLLSWTIPPALSGALIPSSSLIHEPNSSDAYFRIAGSQGLTLGLGSCFTAGGECPANRAFADMELAMVNGATWEEGGAYTQSWGVLINTSLPVIAHSGFPAVWNNIPRSRLDAYTSVRQIVGCMPTVIPSTTCTILTDPPTVAATGAQVRWNTTCGSGVVGDPADGQGTYTLGCEDFGRGVYEIQHLIVRGGKVTQAVCEVSIAEEMRKLTFVAGVTVTFVDGGPCTSTPPTPLSIAEMRGIATSVEYVLRASDNSSTAFGVARSPLKDTLDGIVLERDGATLQALVNAGIMTAATVTYQYGHSLAANLTHYEAVVEYSAYTWGAGYKGYIWATLLALAMIFGLIIGVMSFFKHRLMYDPTDYTQTVFLASGWGSHFSATTDREALKMSLVEDGHTGDLSLAMW